MSIFNYTYKGESFKEGYVMATMYLATLLGWYMLVFGCLLLFRDEHLKAVRADVIAHRGVYFLFGIINFVLGLLMVVSHNIWVMEWSVGVTIVAWLVLITGLIRLILPASKTLSESFVSHPMRMKIAGLVLVIIGGYFLFHVYHFHL
jgi:hypothetical protein